MNFFGSEFLQMNSNWTKCTNINIVDADTCTLDIAKLLKISFYPTREQEEQAILPKPIVTCPPSDG